MTSGSGILKIGDQLFEDPEFLFADSTFFQVFSSFTLQAGSPENVLGAPNQLVLTASAAKKYFPIRMQWDKPFWLVHNKRLIS